MSGAQLSPQAMCPPSVVGQSTVGIETGETKPPKSEQYIQKDPAKWCFAKVTSHNGCAEFQESGIKHIQRHDTQKPSWAALRSPRHFVHQMQPADPHAARPKGETTTKGLGLYGNCAFQDVCQAPARDVHMCTWGWRSNANHQSQSNVLGCSQFKLGSILEFHQSRMAQPWCGKSANRD